MAAGFVNRQQGKLQGVQDVGSVRGPPVRSQTDKAPVMLNTRFSLTILTILLPPYENNSGHVESYADTSDTKC